jgi:hypothetical protein
MKCDVQALLHDARCFLLVNPRMLGAVQAVLWCNIAEAIATGGEGSEVFTLQADNGLWYEIRIFELAPGQAQVDFGQTPVAAGTEPYRVIINLTDGLKYKFKLFEDDGIITGGYDGTGPTLEAETPTIIISTSGRRYQMNFVTDEVITYQLFKL